MSNPKYQIEKTVSFPYCKDRRDCFAKTFSNKCTILTSCYQSGKCPFCKKDVSK